MRSSDVRLSAGVSMVIMRHLGLIVVNNIRETKNYSHTPSLRD
ncbi:MAG: hypothetical protein ABL911_06465 [Gallionella sp.]